MGEVISHSFSIDAFYMPTKSLAKSLVAQLAQLITNYLEIFCEFRICFQYFHLFFNQ